MRTVNGKILLSASDLMRFMGCRYATTLDFAYMQGKGPQPGEDSEDAKLLQKMGYDHELAHFAKLRATDKQVVEIQHGNLEANADDTRQAMREGAEIIFQAALLSGHWGGWPDFLERVENPSSLGNFSYEVTDAKLKRNPHPKHVLQLVLYSDLLAEVQDIQPVYAHIELGSGMRKSFQLAHYVHYARGARARLRAFLEAPEPVHPVPCADCAQCRWNDHCTGVWQAGDSLFNVAGITRNQVKKLTAAGINTLAGLADNRKPIRSITAATLVKLTAQAKLQQARKTGEPDFQLREQEPGKGFYLLPESQSGDLFYDIEGDPYYESGLEYLHGLWTGSNFHTFWAHDHEAEAKALSGLLTFFKEHLARYPNAHIYHYAAYEVTALRRLVTRYGIGEAFLDRLLRERRFVDLYAVVRGGLIASESDYSLKSMEIFYGLERDGEIKTAGSSIVAYEQWRETREQEILDKIEEYNRMDCESLASLRDWLVSIRPDIPWPEKNQDAGEKEQVEDEEVKILRQRLAATTLSGKHQELLFNLAFFHKREAKPAQWAVFDSVDKDEEDLFDGLDALAGLVATSALEPVKRSYVRSYRYPLQETRLRAGRCVTIPVPDGSPTRVCIENIDHAKRDLTIKAGAAKAHLLNEKLTLHPDWPLSTDVIAAAIQDVISDQCGPCRYRAVDDLLAARKPRLTHTQGDISGRADAVAGTIAAVRQMDETVLPVQGPPGTGKTFVTAQAILSLIQDGYRVGVTSNSHEAIRNVLVAFLKAAENIRPSCSVEITHKISGDDDGYAENCPVHRVKGNDDSLLESSQIVGGTAFYFSRDQNIQAFDWLFVDEAGQVGLANMIAMGRAARNIVLVGDPCQLPQVIQGAHPYPLRLSCLEWLLGEAVTVPSDRGIFLPITHRMHPDICRFISSQVYENRLESHPDTEKQQVSNTPWPGFGVFWVPVNHEGNRQVAKEEVMAINAAITKLLDGKWNEKNGTVRPISTDDIIVVAPYNAQVNELREVLAPGIRVGTIDKFQGQEAPICLVSMTASSAEDISRGMEFLFSVNRINTAVSRAKGLALVFGSQRLREAPCSTVEQMRLVNSLCALPHLSP